MTIYFDTCALSRLTDDLSQSRIRQEAEAVAQILELVAAHKIRWIASTVLQFEIEHNPNPIRRLGTLRLLSSAAETVAPAPETVHQASQLSSQGFSSLDALHLAVAWQANVQWFITTDDRFLQRARQQAESSRMELVNPVDFLQRRHLWLLPHPSPSAQ